MENTLSFGLELTLLGMGVVFSALLFLYFIMTLFSIKKIKKNIISISGSNEIDPEIIAVISAACVAVLDHDFEIRKITLVKERRHTNSLWSFQGRIESMQELGLRRG